MFFTRATVRRAAFVAVRQAGARRGDVGKPKGATAPGVWQQTFGGTALMMEEGLEAPLADPATKVAGSAKSGGAFRRDAGPVARTGLRKRSRHEAGKGGKARFAVNVAVGNDRGGDAGPRENAGNQRRKAVTKRGALGGWCKPALRCVRLRKRLLAPCTSRGVVAERNRPRSMDVLACRFACAREVLVAVSREKGFEGQECGMGIPTPGQATQVGRCRNG